jgi:hypothetical protein
MTVGASLLGFVNMVCGNGFAQSEEGLLLLNILPPSERTFYYHQKEVAEV